MTQHFIDPPRVKPKWFQSTDSPKWMPDYYNYEQTIVPVKFEPFSEIDQERIENQYQKYLHFSEPGDNNNPFRTLSVTKDHLFELDFQRFEIKPIYWEGAIYEIRRGIWFYHESSTSTTQVPISYELTLELEKAYFQIKPYIIEEGNGNSEPNFKDYYTLSGDHNEGKFVIFTDSKTAFIIDDIKSYTAGMRLAFIMKTNVGKAMDVIRLTRGCCYETKESTLISQLQSKEKKKNSILSSASEPLTTEDMNKLLLKLSKVFDVDINDVVFNNNKSSMSTLDDDSKLTKDLEDDCNSTDDKVKHLIFCIHGVGQQLGIKYQSFNFIHSINLFRNLLQTVHKKSSDQNHHGVQVLPITWRHKLDFQPENPVKHDMPSLLDITLDSIRPFRNILGSVFFDLLIYYEPRYYSQILRIVIDEIKTTYLEFIRRNPQFEKDGGKVSIMGHSLGSAISFEILSLQEEENILPFKVENFFAVGSPVGLFQLLKTQKIDSCQNNISSKESAVPQCSNLYNISHPCDPVAYRMEPLICTHFKDLKPQLIIPSFLNTIIPSVVTSPFAALSKYFNGSSITKNNGNQQFDDDEELVTKEQVIAGEYAKALVEQAVETSTESSDSTTKLSSNDTNKLFSMNRNGRVDYSIQQGFFDISVLSSVSAHINYFEDESVAWFILSEVLKS